MYHKNRTGVIAIWKDVCKKWETLLRTKTYSYNIRFKICRIKSKNFQTWNHMVKTWWNGKMYWFSWWFSQIHENMFLTISIEYVSILQPHYCIWKSLLKNFEDVYFATTLVIVWYQDYNSASIAGGMIASFKCKFSTENWCLSFNVQNEWKLWHQLIKLT